MLLVKIVNDGTGTEQIGNYDWSVYVNRFLIAEGRVMGHPRGDGWHGLLSRLIRSYIKQVMLKKESL